MNNQTVQKTSFAARLIRAALTASLVAGALFASSLSLSAEGTRDIYETAKQNYIEVNGNENNFTNSCRMVFREDNGETGGVKAPQKFKFYAYEGEVVFLGSSALPQSGALAVTIIEPGGQEHTIEFDTTENTTSDSTNTGFIPTHDKEAAGPNGVFLPRMDYATGKPLTSKKEESDIEYNGLIYPKDSVTDGYVPWEFEVPTNGEYTVIFNSPGGVEVDSHYQLAYSVTDFSSSSQTTSNRKNYIDAWDITVAKVDGEGDGVKYYAQSGRVWATAFSLQTKNSVYGYFYAVTRDGYVWRLGLNGFQPWTTSLYANARGMIGLTTNASLYHSVHEPTKNNLSFSTYNSLQDKNYNPDGINVLGPDNVPTPLDNPYPMFFNYPDSNAVNTTAQSQGVAEAIRFDGKTGTTGDVGEGDADEGDAEGDNHEGSVGAGGYFQVKTSGATSYRVIIDMTNLYAKNYHQAGSGHNGDADNVHDEEICLSVDDDLNFVVYIDEEARKNNPTVYSDGTGWYGIYAADLTNRHPNTTDKMKTASGWDFSSIIAIKILTSDELNATGLKDKVPDGKGNDIGDYQCLGKIMLGNAVDNVDEDDDRIYWNGRDQYGRILPVGQYFGNTGLGKVYAEAKNGEIHFPISDAENISNGLSIWLENPPAGLEYDLGQRSSLYYNNVDKSILRDYVVSDMLYKNGKGTGLNAWYWNLPSNVDCTEVNTDDTTASGMGSAHASADYLDWKWNKKSSASETYTVYSSWEEVPGGASNYVIYENHSIDGVPSYKGDTVNAKTLNKNAGKFSSNCGSDHGVVDFWTHVVNTEPEDIAELDQPVVLTHVADQVIISGFVYLECEDEKQAGVTSQDYDTATNDRAIAGAKVYAEYYSLNNKEGIKTEYETHTNTDGIYSIPVDETKLSSDKKVYITITYNDPEVADGVITHYVTTVDKSASDTTLNPEVSGGVEIDGKTYRSRQDHGSKINECKITISLVPQGVDHNNQPITQKVFYATDVGYFSIPYSGVGTIGDNDPLMIQKIWDPADKKTSNLSATFTILGFVADYHADASTRDGSKPEATARTLKYTAEAGSGGNIIIKKNGVVLEKYSVTNTTGYVFKRSNVSVNEAESGVTKITDLPMYYYPNETNDNVRKQIYYIVVEEPIGGNAAEPTSVVYTADHEDASKQYYHWAFTNPIKAAGFIETVFLDKPNGGDSGNGKYDVGEGLAEAKVSIGLSDSATTKSFDYNPSEAEKTWLEENDDPDKNMFASRTPFKTESGEEGKRDYTTITIDHTYKFLLDYENRDNPFVTEDGVIQFDTLPQGTYIVTIEYPTNEAYNNVFIRGNEEGVYSGTEVISATHEDNSNKVIQTIGIAPLSVGEYVQTKVGVGSFDETKYISDILKAQSISIQKTVTGGSGAIPFEDDFEFALEFKAEDLDVETTGSGNLTTPYREPFEENKKFSKVDSTPKAKVEKFNTPVNVSDLGTISFHAAGKFTYTLKENIPAADAQIPGVTYDKSEYEIVFKAVNDTDTHTSTITVDSIKKVKDKNGGTVDESIYPSSSSSGTTIITFTNDYPTGSVDIKNATTGIGVPEGKVFEYTVAIKKDGKDLAGSFAVTGDAVDETDKAITAISNDGKLRLKKGGSITISNLPEGADVTVTQTTDGMYTTTVEAAETTANSGTQTVEKDKANKITFTNTRREGSLEIKKEVVGDDFNNFDFSFTVKISGVKETVGPEVAAASLLSEPEFGISRLLGYRQVSRISAPSPIADTPDLKSTVKVEISGAEPSSKNETLEFIDGAASLNLTLKKDQTATISGLPAGASYTVTEGSGTYSQFYNTTYAESDKGNIPNGGDPASVTVTNTYKTGTLKVSKTVEHFAEGVDLPEFAKNEEFTFTLVVKPVDGDGWNPDTLSVTAGADSGAAVPSITELKKESDNTWKFSLKHGQSVEILGLPAGATYTVTESKPSKTQFAIKPPTSETRSGTINENTTAAEPAVEEEFVNIYTPVPVSTTISLTKTVSGEKPVNYTDYLFTFSIESADDPATDGVTLPSDKTVTISGTELKNSSYSVEKPFDEIKFDRPGEYKFTVKETTSSANPLFDYDDSEYTVTVKVDDNGEGALVVSSTTYKIGETGKDGITFNNAYNPTPATAELNLTKRLIDNAGISMALKADEFSFNAVLTSNPEGGASLDSGTAQNDTDGKVKFNLKFTKAGTYTVTVTEDEKLITDSRIKADSKTLTVTYTVADDETGALKVTNTSYSDGTKTDNTALTFTNVFTPDEVTVSDAAGAADTRVHIIKKLINTMVSGEDILADEVGEKSHVENNEVFQKAFTFKIAGTGDASGYEITKDTVNNDWGNVYFDGITFSKQGTYVFKVTEEVASSPLDRLDRVGYDVNETTITVTYNVTLDESTRRLVINTPEYSKVDENTGSAYIEAGTNNVIVNTYTPEPCVLTVIKNIETSPAGITPDDDKQFIFKITLEDTATENTLAGTKEFPATYPTVSSEIMAIAAPEIGKITFENGVAYVLLKNNQSISIEKLLSTYKFTVEEITAPTPDDLAKAKLSSYSFDGYTFSSFSGVRDNDDKTNPEELTGTDTSITGQFDGTHQYATVTAVNTYTLTSATATLPALIKTYDGPEPLTDGLFSFTAEISGDVTDGAEFASGGTDKTVANVGGSISFGGITFTKPGTYTVTVNEVIPSPERVGVTYDEDPVTLTYTVTDNKNGTLSVSGPVYGAKTGFTNKYSPAPANTVITVTENLNGALNASETFTVNAALDSSTSSSGAAEASKTVSFTLGKEAYTASEDLSFEFTETGTYVYKVTQAAGTSQGMSYSGESYTVTFTVTDDGFDGQLDCAVSIIRDSDGATADLSFTNTYTTYQYAIENLVVGASVGDSHEFPFTVSFEAEAGKTLIGEYAYAITDIGADVSASCSHTFEENGIPLKGAQDLVISGIPAGAVLKISVPARSGSYDLTMPETSESYYSSSTTLVDNEGNAKFVWTKNPDRYIFKEETYPRDGSSVLVGEEIEYRIHWVNPLSEDNVQIVITDVLDEGLELIDGGDEYNDLTRAVTWAFTANSGEEGYVTLRAKVTAKAAIKGQISNSATMTYNGIEVEAPSNEVINPLNSITVTKTQSVNGISGASAAVREGDVITYTLTVSAEGVEGGSAENVIIADYLPAGLILDQSSLAGGEYDLATGAIVWKIGEISDGSEKSVSYTASVPYVSAYTLWSETAYARAGDPEGHELSLPKISADGWIHSEPVSAYPVGDLSVTKTVQPAPGSDMPASRTEFLFEVRLSDSLGAPLDGAYEFDLSSGASGAAINGYAELRLAGGDIATFKDLPAGTRYSVKEISEASGYTPENGGISEGSVGNSKAPATAEIINTYSFTELSFGTVSVTNIVSGAPESTIFHYRIILGDTSINGVYGGIQFVGGTASFELSSGQSVTFADLPSDISYDVIELEANSLGFETHSSNQSGIVPENESVTAIFYNEKVSGGLLITNTVVGYQSDSARFGYTLYLTDETGAPLTDEFAYFGTQSGTIIGGTALLSLGDGDRIEISGLPKGAAYTLSPLGDSSGFSTEIIGASGVVAANEVSAIEIVSSRKTGGLTVMSRVVGGSGAETYSFVVQLSDPAFSGVCGGLIFTNGVAEVTLTGNQSVTAAGIPSGLSYTVIETNANVGCTTVSVGESGVIPEGSGASAVFTNTVLTPCSLIVSKTVVGHDFSALPFRFSIEISDGFSGQIFDGFGAPVGVISEGVGEFTLSDGQHVLIPSLPVGAAYTVTEIDARGMIPDAAAKTGVITEAGAAEAFVNTVPSGGITVRNTVSGTASDRSRPFGFRLELIGLPLEGIYGDLNFTSGISDFTLSHGQSVNISGIPAGTMFTVTELDAGADGYSTVPAEGFISGVVIEGTSFEAAFVNHKDAPPEVHSGGSLAIINNVVGTETSELFDFTIKLTDAFGNPVSGLYPAVLPQGEIMTLADQTVEFDALGEAHISLRHGERAIISAIPAGCVYSVFETENIYFKVTSINETGTISESVRSTAVFSNKWHVGSLRLTNLVEFETGGNVSYDAQEFEYTITLDQPIDHSLRFNSAAPESGKLMEFVGGVATVTLKNNETAIAVDLPAGVGYTVSAKPVNWYYQRSAVGSSGHIIDGTTSEAEFVYYIKTGSLSISKVVYDYRWLEYEDHTLFPFTVKFTDVNGNPLVGEFGYVGEGGGTVSNGDVINVSGGGKITILGLPEGVTYEITENLTGTRYRILPEYTSGTSGVIQADTESTALVTNLNRSTGPDLPIAPPGPPSQPSTPAEPSVPSIPSLPTVPSETLPSGDSSSDVETIPDDGVEIERPIEGAEVSEDPANPETGLLPASAAAVFFAAAAALSHRRK